MNNIDYKFCEGDLIAELKRYIDQTYEQHYAGGKIQATEDIIDDGHGTGFCIGNAKKYLKRYGKKGESPEEWRKDIMKVLHYSIIQLYVHDREWGEQSQHQPELKFNFEDMPSYAIDVPRVSLNDATPLEWDAVSKKIWK